MRIQTDDEVVTWRSVTYLIDRENGLAFTPSQVRDAGLCHRNLMRRGKISTRLLEDTPKKPDGIWKRFLKSISMFEGVDRMG